MSYDSVLKFLVEESPEAFIQWLLNTNPVDDWEILKTELNLEPIRADALFFLRVSHRILHLEFQTLPQSQPPIPLRMLDYWVRLYRQYRCDIEQVVIFLKPTNVAEAFIEQFTERNTNHRYRVIRIWEVEPDLLLNTPALLPLAVLAKTENPEQLLVQVATEIDRIEDRKEKSNVTACTQLLAGIKFNENLLKAYFREDIMQESVVYNSILEKGLQKGIQQGIQQGEINLILKQLRRRFTNFDPSLEQKISQLSVEQLETLGENLLEIESLDALQTFLD